MMLFRVDRSAQMLARMIWVFALVFVAPHAAWAQDKDVYLDEKGSDKARGLSKQDPLGTLQAALGLASKLLERDNVSSVEIHVLPGTYRRQVARLESVPKGKALSIVGPGGDDRPVFDGAGAKMAWFQFLPTQQGTGALSITGLMVRNYTLAISVAGSRDDLKANVENVLIRNNVFQNIGQIAYPEGGPSSAAIRFVNVDNSRVSNNKFITVRNVSGCQSIHSIYVAHNSTGNLIADNVFRDSCGDSVRFRDASGGNTVVNNEFTDAWADAPVSDWYCDSSSRADCTKEAPECPSFGNEVRDNKVVVGSSKKRPQLTTTYGSDNNARCPGANAKPRFDAR